MRGNLIKKEPVFLERWKEADYYNQFLKKNEGKPSYVLHDGLYASLYFSEMFFIFVGQFISCVILGVIVYKALFKQFSYYLN